jgi:hypothetical protein
MVDVKFIDNKSPILFTTDGYKLVVMPRLTGEQPKPKGAEEVARAETPEAEKVDVVKEAEVVIKASKPVQKKVNHKKEKVAVA